MNLATCYNYKGHTLYTVTVRKCDTDTVRRVTMAPLTKH